MSRGYYVDSNCANVGVDDAAAIDRVAVAADRSPDEFEFYLPQMCSFLLLGVFVQSPQLCRLLLDKCSAYVDALSLFHYI